MDAASVKNRRQLETCKRGSPLIKLMGYELREDAVGGEGSRQWQTHTCTHTYSVLRDTQGGWSIRKDRTQS